MPPKKKAAKKGAAKDITLESNDQLIKSTLEIDALNRELAVKNDIIMRLQASIKEQSIIIQSLQEKIKKKEFDQFDLTTDMSRQYKTMQSELLTKSKQLQVKNQSYQKEIERLENLIHDTTRTYQSTLSAKDMQIDDQNAKMAFITCEFENMLNQTLAKMTKKLEIASSKWKENDSTQLSEASLKRINDFHLTRLKLVDPGEKLSEAA